MNKIQKEIFKIATFFSEKSTKTNINYSLLGGSSLGAVRHQGFIPWDDDFDVVLLPEQYSKLLKFSKNFHDEDHFFLKEGEEDYEMPFSKIMSRNLIFKEFNLIGSQKYSGLYIDIMGFVYTYENLFIRYSHFVFAKFLLAIFLYRRGYKTKIKSKKILLFFASLISPFLPKSKILINFFRLSSPKQSKFLGHYFGKASFNKSVYPSEWFRNTELVLFENKKFFNTIFYKKYLILRYGNGFMEIPPPKSNFRYPAHGELLKN
tara:strand:+ start:3189 stop:3974 length:786 start_codon:yes stop_codon:yes gene_type:complete